MLQSCRLQPLKSIKSKVFQILRNYFIRKELIIVVISPEIFDPNIKIYIKLIKMNK